MEKNVGPDLHTVLVFLTCGYTEVFTAEAIKQNGVPTQVYCTKCRTNSDVMKSKE